MKKDIEKAQDLEAVAQVSKDNKILGKGLVAVGLIAMSSAPAFAALATSSDSFGQLLGKFEDWLSGNLGKLLALLGFIGTFIIYLMTHKGSVLFVGIIISLIAGGISGITETFFNAGSAAFTATS